MKIKIPQLILAGILGTTISSQGVTVTQALNLSTVDDGTLNSSTETWTTSVTGFNGTDSSFDLVITATALNSNTWSDNGSGGLAITGDGTNDARVDGTNEDATFSLSIANFMAGTSGYTVDNVDFGLVELTFAGTRAAGDSGTFSLLNGAAPSSTLTWAETDVGTDFTGDNGDDSFNLQLMNDTFGTGSRLTSFQHDIAGDTWSFSNIDIEYAFVPVPEPSSVALIGLGGFALALRRRRTSKSVN